VWKGKTYSTRQLPIKYTNKIEMFAGVGASTGTSTWLDCGQHQQIHGYSCRYSGNQVYSMKLECRKPYHLKCNWVCYIDRYDDLKYAFGWNDTVKAKIHFENHGRKEGRDCTCPPETPSPVQDVLPIADPTDPPTTLPTSTPTHNPLPNPWPTLSPTNVPARPEATCDPKPPDPVRLLSKGKSADQSSFEVVIGNSASNTKTVVVPNGLPLCPAIVSKENWSGNWKYNDKFAITVEGTKLTAKRIDAPQSGWGMPLRIACAPIVIVGNSAAGNKIITVPEGYSCPKTVSKANWAGPAQHNDRFRVSQTGKTLTVTRVDVKQGWGMSLMIPCKMGPGAVGRCIVLSCRFYSSVGDHTQASCRSLHNREP
jgi:hypothetical protein